MKRLIQLITISLLLMPSLALASSPELQVNPLKYVTTMIGPDVQDGYIDVANPSDTQVNIQATVQGFRQDDLAGNLSFFNNQAIQAAIKLSSTQFTLGPQQAVRVPFSVDPRQLPQGGVFAAIFFRTIPPAQSAATSFVSESANVGTLLLLQNGPADARIGRVAKLTMPFLQLGNGLYGTAQYQNTNHSTAPVAFSPALTAKIQPFGKPVHVTGPYVLPGSTRQFQVSRPGSYFGLLPFSLIDSSSGATTTRWVLACTGIYAFLLLYLFALIVVWVIARLMRRLPLLPKRRRRIETAPSHRPLDGLGPNK